MKPLSRRHAIKAGLGLALAAPTIVSADTAAAENAAILAHKELWRRLVDEHGIILDYTDDDGQIPRPTAEECREGKPNALGWWSPIENGAMFNGLYLEGILNRWRVTLSSSDAEKVWTIAKGLMKLSELSPVKGFVARGIATDGKGHYPMGSNDQTLPWFYGLWRYLESGLAPKDEARAIKARLSETTEAIATNGWKMPAEMPFKFRGSFSGFSWEHAPRVLFLARMMHRVTGEKKWEQRYRELLTAKAPNGEPDRLAACERGMVFDYEKRHSWTAAGGAVALRGLWEMETDTKLREAYARGLQASAKLALEGLPLAEKFGNEKPQKFEGDWRKLLTNWKPQQTEQEAVDLALAQVRELGKLSPARYQEFTFVREPLFAAWIATLTPDRQWLKEHTPEIERTVAAFRYDRLRYSQFFPAECAWWRLRAGV